MLIHVFKLFNLLLWNIKARKGCRSAAGLREVICCNSLVKKTFPGLLNSRLCPFATVVAIIASTGLLLCHVCLLTSLDTMSPLRKSIWQEEAQISTFTIHMIVPNFLHKSESKIGKFEKNLKLVTAGCPVRHWGCVMLIAATILQPPAWCPAATCSSSAQIKNPNMSPVRNMKQDFEKCLKFFVLARLCVFPINESLSQPQLWLALIKGKGHFPISQ